MAAISANHALAKQSAIRLADLRQEAFYLTSQANGPVFNPWLVQLCQR